MRIDRPQARKPYQPPRLVVHGRLEDITRGGCPGNSDADGTSALGSGKGGKCGS
jgi:hypothetical protein